MIWVLLEITLPLCVAFLAGVGAGWLFWRWRRRSITQAEWDHQQEMSATDIIKLSTLEDESILQQQRTEALEATVQHQLSELHKAEDQTQSLSAELATTKKQLTSLESDSLSFEATSEHESQQQSKIEELEFRSLNLQTTVDQQSSELQTYSKDIKRLSEELKAANNQLDTETTNTNAEELQELQSTLSSVTQQKEELETELKQTSAEVMLQKNTADEIKSHNVKLESIIERQADELLESKKHSSTLTDNIEILTAQITDASGSTENDLQALQAELDSSASDIKQTEQHLKELTHIKNEEISQKDNTIQELQSAMNQLETATQTQSSELEKADTKIQSIEDNLQSVNAENEQLKQQLQDASSEAAPQTQQQSPQSTQSEQQQSQQNAELQRQLDEATNKLQTLSDANRKLDETTTQLASARTRNNQLATQLEQTKTPAPVTPISVGQINKLKGVVVEKETLIADLQKQLKTQQKSNSKKQKSAKNTKSPSWQKGKTKIGTPGTNCKDDLTVINGIGPTLEKSLNQLGIKSVEQLATLQTTEIKKVDEALVKFSGRIERDQWVPQAKAIVRGKPQSAKDSKKKSAGKTAKNAKKTTKNKSSKSAWQKGTTKFGTPGSLHKDDLKVINGIGPVIEAALNRRGIKSWEQLATLKVKQIKTIDETLNFPGRIDREQWVAQASKLVKQFPDRAERPTHRTYLKAIAG